MAERERVLLDWARQVLMLDTLNIDAVIADASTRRYVRLRGAQQTHIVMDAPGEATMIAQFARVAGLLQRAGVTVPNISAADAGQGFMIMSDFGKQIYLTAVQDHDPQSLYRSALDSLVRIQQHADASSLPPYDREFLLREMRLFPEWFLERHLGVSVSPETKAMLESVFEFLCDVAREQPQVFVHRDYHSRNLMYLDGSDPGIIDFQDALYGPLGYDLASLLRDVYIEWPVEQFNDWLRYYHAQAGALVEAVDLNTLTRWVDLMGVQRHLKIAGLFVRLALRDGKRGFLDDLPLTLRYLEHVSRQHERLHPLARLLSTLELRA